MVEIIQPRYGCREGQRLLVTDQDKYSWRVGDHYVLPKSMRNKAYRFLTEEAKLPLRRCEAAIAKVLATSPPARERVRGPSERHAIKKEAASRLSEVELAEILVEKLLARPDSEKPEVLQHVAQHFRHLPLFDVQKLVDALTRRTSSKPTTGQQRARSGPELRSAARGSSLSQSTTQPGTRRKSPVRAKSPARGPQGPQTTSSGPESRSADRSSRQPSNQRSTRRKSPTPGPQASTAAGVDEVNAGQSSARACEENARRQVIQEAMRRRSPSSGPRRGRSRQPERSRSKERGHERRVHVQQASTESKRQQVAVQEEPDTPRNSVHTPLISRSSTAPGRLSPALVTTHVGQTPRASRELSVLAAQFQDQMQERRRTQECRSPNSAMLLAPRAGFQHLVGQEEERPHAQRQ